MTKPLPIALHAFLAFFTLHSQADPPPISNFKADLLPALVQAVPRILKSQDQPTGRFGSGIWVSSDQTVIFPLAAVWACKDDHNPFYHDPKLLEAIMNGGDALIAAQDKNGRWIFRKKDNSTWGMHYNPWMYSRWARAYRLIADAMPGERRDRWRKALELGFSGIEKHELSTVHNIPAHQAMGLYVAGKALHHPEWCDHAAAFLARVAAAQNTNGFWSEHFGPVVNYNFVYVDALGSYYGLSHDTNVLRALERSTRFHANFTYPDGTSIETIDERNPYARRIRLPNIGFSFSPEGRAYLHSQRERLTDGQLADEVDIIASWLLYGEEGPVAPAPDRIRAASFMMDDGNASVIKENDWCASFSAYVCPVFKNRWIEDRQNLVSLFHKNTGLILGGGNTKLQPLWSTFTVGDTTLLKHRPGDENPDFSPRPGLIHVPSEARLSSNGGLLSLKYGPASCSVELSFSANTARLNYAVSPSSKTDSIEAHVPLLPAVGVEWRTASGKMGKLEPGAFKLTQKEAGPWFEHNGWRITLPENSTLTWPVLPHNPYRKDGHAEVSEGRIVLTLPFTPQVSRYEVIVTVVN